MNQIPSATALRALTAMVSRGRIIATLRRAHEREEWHATVAPPSDVSLWTIPIRTFHRMRRAGWIVKTTEWEVTSTLLHGEYSITDKGRAIVAAHTHTEAH